jgi:hypothetical protein
MAVKITVEEDGNPWEASWMEGWLEIAIRFTPPCPRSDEANEGSEQGVL